MIFDAGRGKENTVRDKRKKEKVRGTKRQLDTKIINQRFRLHYVMVWFD